MPFIFHDMGSLEFVTTIQSSSRYRPVLGQEVGDPRFLWGVVGDDLHFLPGTDKQLVESLWRAALQLVSSELADAAYVDATKSLLSFPTSRERRWYPLDVFRDVDVANSPGELTYSVTHAPGAYANPTSTGLELGLHHGGSTTWVGVKTASRFPLATVLRSQCVLTMGSSSPTELWMVYGYATLGDMRTCPAGIAVSTAGSVGTWDGATLTTVGTVDPTQELTLSMWLDAANHGYGSGRAVVQVTDGTSTVRAPVDVTTTGLLVDGVYLMAPTTSLVASGFPGGALEIVKAKVDQISFIDAAIPTDIKEIPVIRTEPRVAADSLIASVDYIVVKYDDDISYIQWFVQPPEKVWAESMDLYSTQLIDSFGQSVGVPTLLSQLQDDPYVLNRITALLYGLVTGPTTEALRVGLSGACGCPVAVEEGTVVRMHDSIGRPAIVVRQVRGIRTYYYSPGLRPTVTPGQVVSRWQALCTGPRVRDWVTATKADIVDKLIASGVPEMGKFSSLFVDIPAGSETLLTSDPSIVDEITRYLERALPVWMGTLRVFITTLLDFTEDLSPTDEVFFRGRFFDAAHLTYTYADVGTYGATVYTHRDTFTDAIDARYGDPRGFAYDGSLDYGEADEQIFKDQLHFTLAVDPLGPGPLVDTVTTVFGDPYTIPGGGTPVTVSEDVP
jgi:hypothetical protein